MRCKDTLTSDPIALAENTTVIKTCVSAYSERYQFYTRQIYDYLSDVFVEDVRNPTLRKYWTSPNVVERAPILKHPLPLSENEGFNSFVLTYFSFLKKHSLFAQCDGSLYSKLRTNMEFMQACI